MNFLINLATFILCIAVFAFGGYKTVQSMDVQKIADDFVAVIENATIFPDLTPDEGGTPGGDVIEQPGNGDTPGGDIADVPDNNDNPGGTVDKPGDGDTPGGDVVDKPGDSDTPGGDVVDKPSDNDNPGGDVVDKPADKPTETPTLSTEKAQETFKNLYDNHDSDFTEMKTEMLAGMISGALNLGSGSNGNTENKPSVTPPAEDDDDEDDFNFDNNDDLDDEYIPEASEGDSESEIDSLIADVTTIYSKNLLKEMDANKEANAGLSEEESAAAGEEFVNKEVEALTGLITIVNNASSSGETPEDEKLLQSVDAIIGSEVCLNTVTQSTEINTSLVTKAQEATQNISEETVSNIKDKIESALADVQNSNIDDALKAEKEKQYSDLANLFNITLGGTQLPNFGA